LAAIGGWRDVGKNFGGGYIWPEQGEIFTGEAPKGKHRQNPLRQPVPAVEKSCGWRFLLRKELFFASIATINEEGNFLSGIRFLAPILLKVFTFDSSSLNSLSFHPSFFLG
jgi:hypothetical protein